MTGDVHREKLAGNESVSGQPDSVLGGRERRLRRLLDLQDRERRVLACEIHDGLIQDIVGAQLTLEAVLSRLEAVPPPPLAELFTVRRLLARAVAEGRRLICEISPPAISEIGLVEAVRRWIGEQAPRSGLRVDFQSQLPPPCAEELLEATAFRVIQEALRNVQRHARTETATVRLSQQADQLVIEVEDQGIGFFPESVGSDRFGLESIRQRARLLGGEATIRSVPGQGTCVSVRLPLTADRAADDPLG